MKVVVSRERRNISIIISWLLSLIRMIGPTVLTLIMRRQRILTGRLEYLHLRQLPSVRILIRRIRRMP